MMVTGAASGSSGGKNRMGMDWIHQAFRPVLQPNGGIPLPSVTFRTLSEAIRMRAHHHAPFARLMWCEPQQEWRLVRPATG